MRRLCVGTATCGVAAGAGKVLEHLKTLQGEDGLDLEVTETGCIGLCFNEPLVEVREDGKRLLYGNVTPEFAERLARGDTDPEYLIRRDDEADRDGVLPRQHRIALRRCGNIDPGSLDDYRSTGGYEALEKVLTGMSPEEVIEVVSASGLRGRGGGGFPTGRKWGLAAASEADHKYVICNADEGDPGAFMDRSLLEGDPFSILEGMAICAYAIGADAGIIYCRAEYPKALVRLREAIVMAEEAGWVGDDLLGTDFSFHVKIKEGAGAFVCGEETALMASIEGKRGMPKFRPPYPAVKGLWGLPTNINNVETLANIPWIIKEGPEAFSSLGTEDSKGTKVFALAGRIQRGGLVEVPMGMTIGELVFDVGGGVPEGRTFKAVQMGGPSGGCIPASMADLPIDYKNISATGAIMGSGGIVVLDDTTCMVDMARYFLAFTQSESCGKCTFCRIGTKRMLEILERITAGQGEEEDIERLEKLAHQIQDSSLCGLGTTAPNPVLTTIRYFREEYEAHIRDKKCPAHSCSALVRFSIDADKCTGCGLCKKTCPVDAISGDRKEAHVIDEAVCIRCGKCVATCNFDAIIKD